MTTAALAAALAAAAVALGAAACASARVVERTEVGGTIELTGDRAKAMDAANREMALHCGDGNFSITYSGDEHGAYRVHYACNGAVPKP